VAFRSEGGPRPPAADVVELGLNLRNAGELRLEIAAALIDECALTTYFVAQSFQFGTPVGAV
jgi:hypothetical protein